MENNVDITDEVIFSELPGVGGNIGHILLNRPAALNALNHIMIKAMLTQLTAWQFDAHIKGVLIESASDRAFCAGGDLKNVFVVGEALFHDEYQLNQLIFHYPKPYIAFLDGITMGGGVGISIHGSHRVVTEKVLFAMPETGIGLFPDVGGTYFLPRLPKYTGYYLGLTGARIKHEDCVMLGIARHYVLHAMLQELKAVLINTAFGANANTTVSNIINQYSISLHHAPLTPHFNHIYDCFRSPTIEAIMNKLNELSDAFAKEALAILNKKSPTSLKVTLLALQRGKELTFNECMKMEYRLVCHFLKSSDFAEGIRAIIVDKDQTPIWCPDNLKDVTEDMVASFF